MTIILEITPTLNTNKENPLDIQLSIYVKDGTPSGKASLLSKLPSSKN